MIKVYRESTVETLAMMTVKRSEMNVPIMTWRRRMKEM